MKVVRLSALRTGRFLPPGNIPGSHFCLRLSRPQGHSAARRIMSMKNSVTPSGIEPVTCSAMPQPTAPPRSPHFFGLCFRIYCYCISQIENETSLSLQGRIFLVIHYQTNSVALLHCQSNCIGQIFA